MDLRSLRHFVTLAREGSFVAAAEALNLTQPALSRSIAALEAEMGVRLVERHRKGCIPTPAGELLLRDASAILRQTAALQHTMRTYAVGGLGHLRFGAASLPAALILPSLLGDLIRESPGLTMAVTQVSLPLLMQHLLHDQIEFFLCSAGRLVRDSMTVATPLFDVPLSWVARNGHPLATRMALTMTDLNSYPLACVRSDIVQPIDSAPDTLLDVPVTLGFDDYTIAHAALAHSDAICLSSSALVATNPHLITLNVTEGIVPPSVTIVAVNRRGRSPSPMMTLVLQRIADMARQIGYAFPATKKTLHYE